MAKGVLQVKVPSNGYKVEVLSPLVDQDSFMYETICSDHSDSSNCMLYIHVQMPPCFMTYFRISKGPATPFLTMNMTSSDSFENSKLFMTADNFKDFSFKVKGTDIEHEFSLDYKFYKSY